ncbi:Spc98 family-domain-containing protein [Microdochium bolleyi]|uniref:Spindle pole body component n=1 Tax=Microdochium bolleyi TaxID=196109 RepID=A0A136J789_9PEZI|nr:Spc98 family-domain-containing protein [Microdochium bolleyi]
MAYAAELSACTEELVDAIASATSPRDPSHLNLVKEASLRQLRHYTSLRTNQFEVYKQLAGLEERLRILSRDGLADALGGRMADLAALDLKWAPDVLHFLLELSDKPVEKTRLADLDLLRIPEPEPEAALTWDEIAQEDGWADDRHLWDDVDFANDSSDDGLGTDEASESGMDKAPGSEDATISSLDGSHFIPRPEALIVHVQDDIGLTSVLESQSWRKSLAGMESSHSQHSTITEAQAVREVLFMLRGLGTSLFDGEGSPVAHVVAEFFQTRYPHPFLYLELLFDAACNAQLEGRPQAYEDLATIFLECFGVYIRPIRIWMESGELIDKDKIFFISSTADRLPSHQVWQKQYKLRVTQDGSLVVPRFLHPSIANIFNAGKSITPEPPLDFASITAGGASDFVPFPETFNAAFEKWMETKHHAAYATLRQTLLTSCKLLSEIQSLHSIFLMTDGFRSGLLTNSIFHNLDLLNTNWHDRLALSQVAQEAFESEMDVRRLVVSVPTAELKDSVAKIRTSVRLGLPLIRISYLLPWPLRIVVADEALTQYQAVFTFLLQLRRANYILHRHKPLTDGMADLSQDQTAFYRIRMRLLWFCNVLDTYFTMLVIGPLTTHLRTGLGEAQDVDAMIGVQSAFTKRLIDEMCLGSRLDPIRECILDVLDLAIKLEDARQAEAQRDADSTQELSRLSTSFVGDGGGGGGAPTRPQIERRQRYMQPSEEEDQTFLEEEQDRSILPPDNDDEDAHKDYFNGLCDMTAELDRHVRFLCSGLRGVARASTSAASAKWDTLAEMLEFGVQQEHRTFVA